ncbi:hypothetical protein F5888DRAFT_1731372 [Russula emetica]|nr:hypothetical protein F5888DRAFT_1731372 [Russula emetica]
MQTLTADEIEKNLHERNMLLLVENGESLPLVFHPVLTNYYLKPETTEYINHDHDTSLLHLPPELISLTLQYLSPEDVISCRRTCRTMHNICNDPYLRYHVQMGRCGVSDDLRPGLCYSDRLRILERHEEAWAMLDFRNFHTYDFTGNVCEFSDQPSVGYSYVSLPSLSVEQDQKLQWIERDIGIQILDHDLIAVLTAKADDGDPSDRRMTSEIRLLRFSTGQPHPLAEQPIIFITRKSLLLGHCNIHIEIRTRDEHADMFFLVRWKTGEARRFRFSDRRAHACFSFLSQDTLVIPNLIQFTLKIVKIVIRSDNIPILVPLCVLSLPPLTRRASIVGLDCRAEPNPTGPGPLAIPAPSNRPFRDKSEDASRPFTFIVHRRVLLDHIPAAHRACAPFCSTPEPAPETVQVPWEAWGPSATRWFESDPASVSWITTTAGQRAVTMEDGASTPIIVRDFNPYAVRSARARAAAGGHLQQQCDWNEVLPNGNTMTLKVDDSVLVAGSVFKDDVRSSLPYVEIVTREEYHYEGVLIDEERILGLKTSHEDELMISSMDVHILG